MEGGYQKKHRSMFQRLKFPKGQKSLVDDLAKIYLTVYVSNFPSNLMVRELWNICGKMWTLVDVYIAKHKNKLGKMFAFCRYINLSNSETLIDSLSNVWTGKLRLHANVARFDRKMVVKPSHVGVRVNNLDANKDTQSCKASLSGEGKMKLSKIDQEESEGNISLITLKHDQQNVFPLAILYCYKDFRYIGNTRSLCQTEGFIEVELNTREENDAELVDVFIDDMDRVQADVKDDNVNENKILQVDLWMLRQVWGNSHFNFASTSAKGMPNHRLILLKESEIDYGPTPYRFFHSWLEMEGFHNLVVHTWKNDGEIDRLETKDIAQKAKIKWAIEGDENTSFFHSMLKKKRRQLAIKGILKNEEWIEDPEYFKAGFMEHFRNRFQQPIGIPPSLDVDSLNHLASSQKKSAFIKGRNILDGPLNLNKVMAWYRKRKKKLMLFKVDFEKAFDSLRWDFLDFVMEKLGRPSRRDVEFAQLTTLRGLICDVVLLDQRDSWQRSPNVSVGFSVASVRSLVDDHTLVCADILDWFEWLASLRVSDMVRSVLEGVGDLFVVYLVFS
nr:hypothetical protein [Tanacetum cinerariifolium]